MNAKVQAAFQAVFREAFSKNSDQMGPKLSALLSQNVELALWAETGVSLVFTLRE